MELNTAAIHVNKNAYDTAVKYAKEHDTSVDKLFETFVLTLAREQENMRSKPLTRRFSPLLLGLVGVAKSSVADDDLNGDEQRWEYLNPHLLTL
jgi:hypothetical protein